MKTTNETKIEKAEKYLVNLKAEELNNLTKRYHTEVLGMNEKEFADYQKRMEGDIAELTEGEEYNKFYLWVYEQIFETETINGHLVNYSIYWKSYIVWKGNDFCSFDTKEKAVNYAMNH